MARKKALVCKFIPGMEALKDWSSHGFAVFRNSSWIMILQAYLNGFGSVVIAGYTAAGKVENLVTQPFTTLAAAMEVYCGQNYGAGRPDRIRKGISSSLKMGGVAAAECWF